MSAKAGAEGGARDASAILPDMDRALTRRQVRARCERVALGSPTLFTTRDVACERPWQALQLARDAEGFNLFVERQACRVKVAHVELGSHTSQIVSHLECKPRDVPRISFSGA